MPIYKKESLETLRNRIDIIQVLETFLELKKSGATYKALCPFHEEKTPSFVIQPGDHHYHCFGCGAHGDTIQFLMNHESMGFVEAVEFLAERFQVTLEHEEEGEYETGPSKKQTYEGLEEASLFYHTLLLHTPEGHHALQYLYSRGLDLEFIKQFQIGYAPKYSGHLSRYMHKKSFSNELLIEAGLLRKSDDGKLRDFFSDRITFPIFNPQGRVIGFSARKFHERTYGGKYVNSQETAVFKKSRILYGLNYCRKRIAKEKQVVIVEGQIDCLRLINKGLSITVAGQGTAFGEGQVQELLSLGAAMVYIAFDNDEAGLKAAMKVGNFFQREGVEVVVCQLPKGSDPDSFVRNEGIEAFLSLMDTALGYLNFLVDYYSKQFDINSPAGKNELVYTIARQINEWNDSVMVYESLKKLAKLTNVPEEMVLVGVNTSSNIYVKASAPVEKDGVNPELILETDFLRWLLIMGDRKPELLVLAQDNIKPDDLQNSNCRQIYYLLLKSYEEKKTCDWMTLASHLDPKSQILLSELHQKKVNKDKAYDCLKETVQKMLNAQWLKQREHLRLKIQSSTSNEEEVIEHVKEFDKLKKNPPVVKEREHA